MVIYIDVLVILNLYVTFFLIKATARLAHVPARGKRLAAGTALGGVSSLVILLPPLGGFLTILVKAAIGGVIAYVSFGNFRPLPFFIAANLIFAGTELLLCFIGAPLAVYNGVGYIDVSFLTIVVSTALAYGGVRLARQVLDGKAADGRTLPLTITKGGHTAELCGFGDSGNTLTDAVSGLSVIIIREDTLCGVMPPPTGDDYAAVSAGYRLIPYGGAGYTGLMPVFRPDKVTLGGREVDALVGVSALDGVQAVFNPKLLT